MWISVARHGGLTGRAAGPSQFPLHAGICSAVLQTSRRSRAAGAHPAVPPGLILQRAGQLPRRPGPLPWRRASPSHSVLFTSGREVQLPLSETSERDRVI